MHLRGLNSGARHRRRGNTACASRSDRQPACSARRCLAARPQNRRSPPPPRRRKRSRSSLSSKRQSHPRDRPALPASDRRRPASRSSPTHRPPSVALEKAASSSCAQPGRLLPKMKLRSREQSICVVDLTCLMRLEICGDLRCVEERALAKGGVVDDVSHALVEGPAQPSRRVRRESHLVEASSYRLWNSPSPGLTQQIFVPRSTHFPLGSEAEGKAHQAMVEERQTNFNRMGHRVAVLHSQVQRQWRTRYRLAEDAPKTVGRHRSGKGELAEEIRTQPLGRSGTGGVTPAGERAIP